MPDGAQGAGDAEVRDRDGRSDEGVRAAGGLQTRDGQPFLAGERGVGRQLGAQAARQQIPSVASGPQPPDPLRVGQADDERQGLVARSGGPGGVGEVRGGGPPHPGRIARVVCVAAGEPLQAFRRSPQPGVALPPRMRQVRPFDAHALFDEGADLGGRPRADDRRGLHQRPAQARLQRQADDPPAEGCHGAVGVDAADAAQDGPRGVEGRLGRLFQQAGRAPAGQFQGEARQVGRADLRFGVLGQPGPCT